MASEAAGAGGGGAAAPGGDHRRRVPDPRLHERRALQRWPLVLFLSLRRGRRRAPVPGLRYSAAATLRGLGRRRRRGRARSRRVARRGEAPVQVRRGGAPGVHRCCVILRAGKSLITQIIALVPYIGEKSESLR